MTFTFEQYNVKELYKCGEEFKNHFSRHIRSPSQLWTKEVLEWFADTKPENADHIAVYGSSRSEFIVDLCHLLYPRDVERLQEPSQHLKRWERVLETGDFRIKLALESEWGSATDRNRNHALILDDASKLAVIRAEVKVMLFGSHGRDDEDSNTIISRLAQLRRAACDVDPWLCIDVPWEGEFEDARSIRYRILPNGGA